MLVQIEGEAIECHSQITIQLDGFLFAMKLKKVEAIINKPAYLGFSFLEEVHLKYMTTPEKDQVCYIDTDDFTIHIKTTDN